ncbi:cysteamine dioxygenase [Angomonas deanei]|nr:cysteamine dioxygenase [Angomonas deanei]EPY39720.1 cysteamine dioxygenase [Angomonas deanei]|eukprot:EPY34914.1 cysteamine dioxygenase [Angomonas deanei]
MNDSPIKIKSRMLLFFLSYFYSFSKIINKNMSLLALRKALSTFSKTNAAPAVELFRQLTPADLGYYVSDDAAMEYMQSPQSFPILSHGFKLGTALRQELLRPGEEHHSPMIWMNSQRDRIGCSTLYEDEQVTLCWFVVPPRHTLGLHDHPTMTVWQRVLFGRLQVTAMDFEGPPPTVSEIQHCKDAFPGVVRHTGEVSSENSGLLHFTPESGGGVLHELTNPHDTEPALFIDIIAPPYYREKDDLPCTYYIAEKRTEENEKNGKKEKEFNLSNVDSGLVEPLVVGDKVRLVPRRNYGGPALQAFVHLQD